MYTWNQILPLIYNCTYFSCLNTFFVVFRYALMMMIQLMYLIWKCAVMFSQWSWGKSGSTLQGGLCGSIWAFIRAVQSLETTEPLLSGWSTQQRETYSSSQCAEITSTSATAVCLHLLQWVFFYWHPNSPRLGDIQFILLKDIWAHHFTCSSVLMRCRAKRQLWHTFSGNSSVWCELRPST